ncbi:rhomboid family intramembrane serine protease [Paenibacillus sp. PL2-23]|uniref:rhomboid family intramembrane serine protease n=1 Tax=Paenibacillus sp. PL2-23 TaxID=2100729 RepID=UPI0030F714CE
MFLRRESLKEYIRLYPVVSILLILNIVMFILLEWDGSSTSQRTLLEFGAMSNFPGYTEPWHFVSAMFLHIGFMHLLMNGFALYVFAAPLERMLGRWRFALLYLVSGIIGNAVSLVAQQEAFIGAGASGAIYGVYAAYVYLSLFHKTAFGHHNASTIQTIVVVGVIYSIITPNVDLYAHLGGFVGGFLMTTLYVQFRRR